MDHPLSPADDDDVTITAEFGKYDKVDSNSDTRRMRLDVCLAEYNRAWAEIAARFANQLAAFTIFAGALAGVLAFGKLTDDLPQVCLIAPLFIAPLSYIFFDNELQIWRVATYTRVTLRSRIAKLTCDETILGLDSAAFRTRSAKNAIPLLSFGRWVIFFIPACIAIAVGYPTASTSTLWLFVLICDVGLVLGLAVGICAACAEQSTWKRDTAREREASLKA